MNKEKQFKGGCLVCNFETTDRNELNAHACTQWKAERKGIAKMATVLEVLEVTENLAPDGWTVTHEYPNHIGVTHPTFTDEQFISFGNVNFDFGFNDVYASDICGDMKGLTSPAEIAVSFWLQVGKFYPELMEKTNGITAEQLSEVIQILKLQNEGK